MANLAGCVLVDPTAREHRRHLEVALGRANSLRSLYDVMGQHDATLSDGPQGGTIQGMGTIDRAVQRQLCATNPFAE